MAFAPAGHLGVGAEVTLLPPHHIAVASVQDATTCDVAFAPPDRRHRFRAVRALDDGAWDEWSTLPTIGRSHLTQPGPRDRDHHNRSR